MGNGQKAIDNFHHSPFTIHKFNRHFSINMTVVSTAGFKNIPYILHTTINPFEKRIYYYNRFLLIAHIKLRWVSIAARQTHM